MHNFKNTMTLIAIVAILLPNIATAQKLDSNLRNASKKGQIEKVTTLLREGADVNSSDKKGRAALMLAAEKGHLDVVQFLLEKNADVSITDKKGETALVKARKKKKTDVVLILEFAEATQDNTVKGYEQFLTKYPDSKFTEEAMDRLKKAEFNEVKKLNTIQAYEQFLAKYPNSILSEEEKSNLISLEFKNTKRKNTVEAYEQFMQKYPDSILLEEAQNNLMSLEFEQAKKDNNYEAYQNFIEKYPEGKFSMASKAQSARLNYLKYKDKKHFNKGQKEIVISLLEDLESYGNEYENLTNDEDAIIAASYYTIAGELYELSSNLRRAINFKTKDALKKSAYFYYKATKMCQVAALNVLARSFNRTARGESSLSEYKVNLAIGIHPWELKKNELYEKSVELFKKAGFHKYADWMLQGGTIKSFSFEEIK